MKAAIAVFIGGGVGSILRYLISHHTLKYIGSEFPWGTFISNMLACLVLALTVIILRDKLIQEPLWRLLIITGFCGGFSTFSTFSLESFSLVKHGHVGLAVLNILVSVFVGFLVMYLLLKNIPLDE